MLTIRHLENRIDMRSVSPDRTVEFTGQTIAELAPNADCAACMVNDNLVMRTIKKDGEEFDNPDWGKVPPDGSILIFSDVDGDQTITGAIITVIAAIATVAAIIIPGAQFLVPYTLGLGLTGLAMIAGGLLAPSVSGLDGGGGGDGYSSSPTYGFDSIQNVATPGTPIPIVYGEHLVGGQIIMAFRRGSSNFGQTYSVLIALSEGPVQSIGQYTTTQNRLTGANLPTGQLINDIEAKEFKDVKVSLRLGATTETVMPGFEETILEYPQPQDMALEDGQTLVWKTKEKVDDFAVNVIFPNGLWHIKPKKNGTLSYKSHSVGIKLTVYEEDGVTPITGDEARQFVTSANRRERLYRTLRFEIKERETPQPIGPKRYVIKVQRTFPNPPLYRVQDKKGKSWGDKVIIQSVLEIKHAPIAYNGLAKIGVEIRGSNQLSGQFPKITTMMKGRIIHTDAGDAWSDNPAWIAYDILTSKRYGLGNKIGTTQMYDADFEELADHADELIPIYTGSGSTEKRYMFNGVLDRMAGGWEHAMAVLSTCSSVPLKTGNSIKVKTEKTKSALQIFNMANIKAGTLEVSFVNPKERPNVIEVRFLNEDKNFEQDTVQAEIDNLDESQDSVRRKSVSMFGCTRESQANRLAYRLLRVEQMTIKQVTFETTVEALAAEPLDVVKLAHDLPAWSESGELVGTSGGNIQLDREVTLESGKLYTYTERNELTGALLESDFTGSGTSDVLSFAPLHGGTGETVRGRKWILGPKFKVEHLIMITKITPMGAQGLGRKIEGIMYSDLIYSDEARELDDGTFIPTPGAAPNVVTNLAAVETSTIPALSTLTVSWTAAAGASYYNVYSRMADGVSDYDQVGNTPGTSLAFDSDARLGQAVEILVQTVNPDGQRSTLSASPSITHVITREDAGTDLVTFPADIANLGSSVVSGNTYRLNWDTIASVTYEVRLGHWMAGKVIATGIASGTSQYDVEVQRTTRKYSVRAKNAAGWYSSANGRVIQAGVALAGYATESESGQLDLIADGTRLNAVSRKWFGQSTLLQAADDTPLIYISKTFDLGSAAATHVSVDPYIFPAYLAEPDSEGLYTSMKHYTWGGETDEIYINWKFYIEYSDDEATWNNVDFDDYLNSDLILTARYFRFQFVGAGGATPITLEEGDDPDTTIQAIAMIEKILYAFYRA